MDYSSLPELLPDIPEFPGDPQVPYRDISESSPVALVSVSLGFEALFIARVEMKRGWR
ncbi:hypothetical protein B9Z19DRAFT_1132783 [Tuber borchii]|uniref:Uncharacterized protein n=1 Tax=Tuber borchii TaxID=42251 RepID=A0A2T6ZGQ8_TUBBO|nr:hypothetical protein B9Z19DRAFT_1132783 [Tuber borchii]